MPSRAHNSAIPRRGAFTLLELVVVLAIITTLMAVGGTVFIGQRAEAKNDRARADLQVIQQGLEAYRARFGDYPQIPSTFPPALGVVNTNEEYLLNALFGKIGPAHQEIRGMPIMLNSSLFSYANSGLPMSDDAVNSNLKGNWIVDPWGTAYEYDYKPKDSGWLLFGYTLRSAGPDLAFSTDDDLIAE